MGKAKKIGIGIGIAVALFFIVAIAIGSTYEQREEELKQTIETASLSPEQIKSQAIDVSYDDLMRHNEDYVGKYLHSDGRIIQVENVYGDTYVLRVGTGGFSMYDDIIWVNYAGERVLEDDIVELWGEVKGLKEYTAIFGNSVTLPEIDAAILDVVEKQGDQN